MDTHKFLINPKGKDFPNDMLAMSPAFNFKIDKVNQRKALAYLTYMYDKESDIRKSGEEYAQRKYRAGIEAGFLVGEDNKFAKDVEDAMLGHKGKFNKALIQYVSMMYDNDYKYLVILEHNYNKKLLEALSSNIDDKDKKLINDMREQIITIEAEIFGGSDVNLRKALYEGTSRTRDILRPENVTDEFAQNGLIAWCPYPNYVQGGVKFISDGVPE